MIENALYISVSCFVAFVGSYFLLDIIIRKYRRKAHLSARLSELSSSALVTKDKLRLFQKSRSSLIEKKLHGYLSLFKSENWFQLQLYRSGLSISLTKSMLLFFSLSILVTYFLTNYTIWSFFVCIIGGASIVGGLMSVLLMFLKGKRRENISKYLPVALDIILRTLKSGYSLEKTFAIVATQVHPSVGDEFRQIIQHISIGVSYEQAMRFAAERVDSGDFYFFANALIIQRQTGGSLSETIENILFLLRRRHEIRLKIRVLSSEARTTGAILASVPVALGGVIMALKPEYMDFFFYDAQGQFLLKVVIAILVSEALIIKWLVNIDVD